MKRLLLTTVLAVFIAAGAHASIDDQAAITLAARHAEEQRIAQIAEQKRIEFEKAEALRIAEEQRIAAETAAAEEAERQRQLAAAKPKPASPSSQYAAAGGVERWRDLVASYFGSEVDYALRIMACESGGNPNASSPTNDHGLMQINYPSHYNKVNSVNDLYDPATNMRVAKQIRDGSGWGAWTCSRKI